MTFLLNCIVVVVFVLAGGIEPRQEWFLLLPLILEFYAFVLGISLIFSSLYVRFRDVGQIWEVLSTVLLYSSAVMYPLRILPGWARHVVSFDPLVQVTQDARLVVLGGDPAARPVLTIVESRLWGIAIALLVLALGIWLHRRESPRFPELA